MPNGQIGCCLESVVVFGPHRRIILAHNHPSGQLEPSEEDLLVTLKMVEAGRTLDIEVVDHIIYTANGYSSIRELAPSIFVLESEGENRTQRGIVTPDHHAAHRSDSKYDS